MSFLKRFHLLLRVIPVVAALVLLKWGAHALGWEFVPLDGLVPSLIAGSIFLIGFLLQQVLADYKESEHMPGDIRVALEAIHDDVLDFAETTPGVDLEHLRGVLVDIVEAFQTLRDSVAERIFPGSRVVVDLCDDSLSVKKTLSER